MAVISLCFILNGTLSFVTFQISFVRLYFNSVVFCSKNRLFLCLIMLVIGSIPVARESSSFDVFSPLLYPVLTYKAKIAIFNGLEAFNVCNYCIVPNWCNIDQSNIRIIIVTLLVSFLKGLFYVCRGLVYFSLVFCRGGLGI